MNQVPCLPQQRRRTLTVLLVLLFGLAYAIFTQDPVSHNTLCRAATTANMVQHGRIDINGYDGFTRDKAFNNGNFYCDKAPGLSFLAVPTAFAFTRVFDIDPGVVYSRTWTVFQYLLALSTSGALCLLAAVLLFRDLLHRTGQPGAALIGALAFGLGSSMWGWATSMFSHAAAGALLVIGFLLLDRVRGAASEKHAAFRALGAGLALGGAVAVSYTALVPAIIISTACAITSDWRNPAAVFAVFALAAAGALVTLTPVLVFHAAAFGNPFTTGYAYTVEFPGHHAGLFGIGVPRFDVLTALFISPERGFIWYAPVVLAALWGAVRLTRRQEHRLAGIVTMLIAIWYLLMNAGFAYWEGGASTGPRYLTPALGFSAIALGLAWPMFTTWERRAGMGLLSVSILINFAATAVDMTAGGLTERILPSFLEGDLRQTLTYLVIDRPSLLHFSLPMLAGGVIAWLIWREMRGGRQTASGSTTR